ncbi:MFS transporter [Phenylobacterium sp.]|uniref:MFS transporter n=1 Tax=Phenylobacterium sp. TaxID=1871053 RepID=UPI002E2FA1B0|nr:MFS transporter [Phenylobacterium sp.]HEX2559921.1 MFS transporter [Phenylobacterium sp.]
MQSERRSSWTLAALAGPCLPMAGLGLPLVVYLPEHYANELGLPLAAVGLAFMGVRLLDILFDPFIGGVMDRTRSRFGRFKLWFVIGTPIVMLSTYMLFMAERGVGVGYLWLWLLVIYAGFSITTLAQLAWAAGLSPNYDQRSRIYAWWQGGNVIGIILVLTLAPLLSAAGVSGDAAGVAAMGWFILALMPLTVGLAVATVPEQIVTHAPHKAGLREYLALIRRPSVFKLLLADLFVGTGPAITGGLFFFYFERVKGFDHAAAGTLLLVYFIGGLIGAPIWTRMAFKTGKHRALAISGVFYAIVTAAVYFLPAGNYLGAAIMMFLIGLPYSAGAFLLRAMMADIADEERLASGVDRTGLLFAILSGTVKIGSAAAIGITFVGLELIGFDARTGGGNEGLAGLQVMFLVLPILLALLASWIILSFPLTAEKHAQIRAALAERDLAEAAPEMGAEPKFAEEIHATVRPAQ